MGDSKSLGQMGEDLAADHLIGKGYSIRHRNWKSGKNEVDIIAENSKYIVFVEVKTRSGKPVIPPGEMVNKAKQNTIVYCADNYIRWYNISKEGRFDVIIVEVTDDDVRIDHIEDAFYPTLR